MIMPYIATIVTSEPEPTFFFVGAAIIESRTRRFCHSSVNVAWLLAKLEGVGVGGRCAPSHVKRGSSGV